MADSSTEVSNPQFLGWVEEWVNSAKERNAHSLTTYNRAYHALKACPIRFEHPAELEQLKGFGPKLCARLTEKLQTHCKNSGTAMPEHPKAKKAAEQARQAQVQGDGEPMTKKPKKARAPKLYVPAYRSGAYALVLGLSTLDEDSLTGMTKAELIEAAEPHCDASFTAPSDPTKFYTAWNSMKTLIQKELVVERGRPLRRYALTDDGWEVARRTKKTKEFSKDNETVADSSQAVREGFDWQSKAIAATPGATSAVPPDMFEPSEPGSSYQNIVADGQVISSDSALPAFIPIRIPPGSFEVKLLLDIREVRAKTDRDYMQQELAKLGVPPIMRALELGDAQWIAKCHDPDLLSRHGLQGDEVVLDWIVERKRLDDLLSSIKDGRFHEQKFRLKRSGVKKVVYIIEQIAMDLTEQQADSINTAIASTQVSNGYFVKRTERMDETIRYLAKMTSMLKKIYEQKPINIIPTEIITARNYLPLLGYLRRKEPTLSYHVTYPAFASLASKSDMMTLKDIFLKMLMTMKGITGERALAIQERWKTPHDFVKAFEAWGTGVAGQKRKREFLHREMGDLVASKAVGKDLSSKIAEVWGDV
jgi:crossover junction endonuclease MUS81